MESQSLSSPPFLHSHRTIHKLPSQKPISQFFSPIPFNSKPLSVFNGAHFSSINKTPLPNPTNPSKPLQNPQFLFSKTSSFHELAKTHLPFALTQLLLTPLPGFALEADQASDKINLESILLSIDDFFNRYPFFVAGCTFIWLVGIPLIEYFFRKYKFVSAIDAFRKIRDDPNAQLLDIRDEKSLAFLGSPNLRILNKDVVQVVYSEEDEDGFVKKVKKSLGNGADTVVFVLDK